MDYIIKQIKSEFLEANCYLIKFNNKYLIVDPCVSVSRLKKFGVEEVLGVLVTHAHVDHIFYIEEVIKEYKTKAYFSKKAIEKVFNDSLNLSIYFEKCLSIDTNLEYKIVNDNETISFDELDVKCIYTPGHSNCSICYLIKNDLFTGDTLFDGSVGRTDLYSGNSLQLKKSLVKLIDLKTNFTIYPGHDSISTLNEQLKYNRYLKSENIFIK